MQNLLLLLSAFVSGKHVKTFLEEEANGRIVLKDSAEGDAFNKPRRELGLRTLNDLDRVSVPRRLVSPVSSASGDNAQGGSDIGAPQSPQGTQQLDPPAAPSSIPHLHHSEEKTQQPGTQQPEDNDICTICLEPRGQQPDDQIAHFNCGDGTENARKHLFHEECIVGWIRLRDRGGAIRTCPLCRQDLSPNSSLNQQVTERRASPDSDSFREFLQELDEEDEGLEERARHERESSSRLPEFLRIRRRFRLYRIRRRRDEIRLERRIEIHLERILGLRRRLEREIRLERMGERIERMGERIERMDESLQRLQRLQPSAHPPQAENRQLSENLQPDEEELRLNFQLGENLQLSEEESPLEENRQGNLQGENLQLSEEELSNLQLSESSEEELRLNLQLSEESEESNLQLESESPPRRDDTETVLPEGFNSGMPLGGRFPNS